MGADAPGRVVHSCDSDSSLAKAPSLISLARQARSEAPALFRHAVFHTDS